MISYNDGQYCKNGDLSISINDPGFMRGQVAYEAIRVYEGELFDFEGHLERLHFSLKKLAIKAPKIDLKKICRELNKKNEGKPCLFRIYFTPGIDQKGSVYIFSDPITPISKKSHRVCTAPSFRSNPLIKSTHYGPAMSELATAEKNGFDDVLFVTKEGDLLELAFSNFFAIKDDELLTPSDGILPGVTRKHILEIASQVRLSPVCRQINIRELPTFDEVFHTNTTKEVMPISQIDEISYPSHRKTTEIHEAFKDYLTTYSLTCH